MSNDLLGPLFYGTPIEKVFSAGHQLQQLKRFEVALAEALEGAGLAPSGTAADIERASLDFPSSEQISRIAEAAVQSGNLAIPFVKELTAQVRRHHQGSSDFVHFGATSQDVLDTALVLQLKQVFELIEARVETACSLLMLLTRQHGDTILAGRSWMQQGPPILFGLKTAGWLSAMLRHRERIAAVKGRVLALEFGGAVGTLASLGNDGNAVAVNLAARLDLRLPEIPWHSQRDNIAEVAATFGLLTGTLGKIARDISLMMQTEVAELSEHTGPGAGGSSTMPHKHNSVNAALVISASISVPGLVSTMLSAVVQEHERGLGGWHAEWVTLPEICKLTFGSLDRTTLLLQQLEIDPARMSANLNLLQGAGLAESVSMLLAPHLGRPAAHQLLEEACRAALDEKRPLDEVLQQNEVIAQHLSNVEIANALKPENYLGQSRQFIAQVLALAEKVLSVEDLNAIR